MEQVAPIALVTGSFMPKPDPETHLVVDALAQLGLQAEIVSWDANIDWARFSLVVVRTPWDYFQHLDKFLAWLKQVDAVTRLTNPRRLITWNCHKGYLRQLAEAGLPTVPTIWLERNCPNPAELLAADDYFRQWDDIVVKPAISIGAINILRTQPSSPAFIEHLHQLLATDDVLIQPFLPSIVRSGEVSLIFFGGNFSHAVRKVPCAGDYRVQDLYGGSVQPYAASQREISLSQDALEALPVASSYARVDLVPHDDHWVIMEVEMIEPELFLAADPSAACRFAETLLNLVNQ